MNPSGQVALITGAASGIGRASARLLAEHGAHVVVADVDEAGGRETVELIASHGGSAEWLRLDVSDPAALEWAFDDVTARHGALDILHNNAAIMSGPPEFPDMYGGRVAAMVNVNVTGPAVATMLAIRRMAQTGGGVVINMSSTSAAMPDAAAAEHDPIYAMTKAAVKFFSEAMAPYADSHGVRVNVILPGAVATPIIDKTGGGRPAQWLVGLLDQVALLPAERIAETVLELVLDDTRAGEAVVVANGS